MASIDGLRGLAALSVFTFHAWLYTMPTPAASQRSSLGDYAAHELRVGLAARRNERARMPREVTSRVPRSSSGGVDRRAGGREVVAVRA